MQLTDLTLAYLAGVADGESCFTIYKQTNKRRRTTPNYSALFRVVMCDEEAVRLFSEVFQRPYRMLNRKTKGGKSLFLFEVHSKDAIRIAGTLLPYLRVKQNQAKLLLRFGELMGVYKGGYGHSVPPEAVEQKEYLYRLIKSLHQ